ncbi:MAG: hypothetical protein WAU61_15205 [Smithella sp.]
MKKIIMTVLIINAFGILGLAASIFAGDVTDYSGMWAVTWLDNNTRNPMSLNQNKDQLTGIYTNDNKESCSVTGEYIKSNRQILLSIKCPAWGIQMDGIPSLDGKTIEGKYVAYGTSAGKFIMAKNDK